MFPKRPVLSFTQSEPSSWRARLWVRASGRACLERLRGPLCTPRHQTRRPATSSRWPKGTWRGSACRRWRRRRRGKSGCCLGGGEILRLRPHNSAVAPKLWLAQPCVVLCWCIVCIYMYTHAHSPCPSRHPLCSLDTSRLCPQQPLRQSLPMSFCLATAQLLPLFHLPPAFSEDWGATKRTGPSAPPLCTPGLPCGVEG